MRGIAEKIIARLTAIPDKKRRIIAIDGRCASGKTTLASELRALTGCAVYHMDDYFPRPQQRTPERLASPGGNVDWERFREEILIPLCSGAEEISRRAFDCGSLELLPPVLERAANLVVVEGSYSCHPELWKYYSLRVFLTVDPEEQLRRILERDGPDKLVQFKERWIPMEEKYFSAFDVQGRCDLVFET